MIDITIDSCYYPVYEAYSRKRGLLFFLLRGGWRKSYTDKDGKEKVVYRIWAGDEQFLRLMCTELPF
jgi:hypothetical protein